MAHLESKTSEQMEPIRVKKNSFILNSTPNINKIKAMKNDSAQKNGDDSDSGSGTKLYTKSVSSDSEKRAINATKGSDVKSVVCDSPHDSRQRMCTIFPVNIDVLMTTMYSKSKKMLEFREIRRQVNVVLGDWTANEDGTKSRTVKFTQELKSHLGPKTSQVTELQVLRKCSVKGQMYSIDIMSWNEGIPYSDTFYIMSHHCLVRAENNQTKFTAYAEIKYKKPQWGIFRTILEKSVNDGLEENYVDLDKFLRNEICEKVHNEHKPYKKLPQEKSKPSYSILMYKEVEDYLIVDSVKIDDQTTKMFGKGGSNQRQRSGSIRLKESERNWMPLFVIGLLLIVGVTNIYLLLRLQSVEQNLTFQDRIDEIISSSGVRSSERTEADWMNVLRHQERVHRAEIVKWQDLLEIATKMIRDTEGSLVELFRFMVLHDQNSTKNC